MKLAYSSEKSFQFQLRRHVCVIFSHKNAQISRFCDLKKTTTLLKRQFYYFHPTLYRPTGLKFTYVDYYLEYTWSTKVMNCRFTIKTTKKISKILKTILATA